METIGSRRGEMMKMSNHGSARAPGFQNSFARMDRTPQQLLTDTRGPPDSFIFEGWTEYGGDMALRRRERSSRTAGVSTAYALWVCRNAATSSARRLKFTKAWWSAKIRRTDMEVNVTKEKKLTNMRSSSPRSHSPDPAGNSAWSSH